MSRQQLHRQEQARSAGFAADFIRVVGAAVQSDGPWLSKDHLGIREQVARKFIQILLPVIAFTIVVTCVVNVVFEGSITRHAAVGAAVGGLVGAYIAHRLGRPVVAISVLIAFLATGFVVGMMLNNGVRAPAFSATVALMAVVGWFYSVRATLVFFLFTFVIGFVLAMGTQNGWWREGMLPSAYAVFIYMTSFQIAVLTVVIIGNQMVHRALASVRRQEQLVETIQESVGVGLITLDRSGALVHINAAAKRLLPSTEGGEASLLQAACVLEGTESPTALIDAVERLPQGKEARVQLLSPNGTRWLSIAHYPHILEEVRVGSILALQDISDRIALDQRLAHTEKLEMMGQLASGIVHDFKNNIGGVQGALDLMLESDEDERDEYVELIRQASDNALELSNKLLRFSRKEEKATAVVDIHSALQTVVFLLKRTVPKNIKISVETDDAAALVLGDEGDIQNAFLNMGINAAHAMPQGGTLVFSTGHRRLTEAVSSSLPFDLQPGDYVEIRVVDSGTGVPDEIKEKIFDPFFTTKEKGKGTGLGLAAVLRMVEEQHGAVEVTSEPGKGTAFTLLLPVYDG